MDYVINGDKLYQKDTYFQSHHDNGRLFGIQFDGKQSTMDALIKMFDVCDLLGTNESYFNFLNKKLIAFVGVDYSPDEITSIISNFSFNAIKTCIQAGLDRKMIAFAESMDRYDARKNDGSFEFLKCAYANLDAVLAYKSMLDIIYEGIKTRQYPLEVYHEIRRSEHEHINFDLEWAVIKKELIDVAVLAMKAEGKEISKGKNGFQVSELTKMVKYLKANFKQFDPQNKAQRYLLNYINSPILSPTCYERIKSENSDAHDKESLFNIVSVLVKTAYKPDIDRNIN